MLSAKEIIKTHATDNVADLALTLAKQQHPQASFILRQIEGQQKLSKKVPSWTAFHDIHYPQRLSLEQCSGEAAARYKRSIITRLCPIRKTMIDLTGGLGVDFSFLAPLFEKATYVEQHKELTALAHHNFPLLGLSNTSIIEGDGIHTLLADSQHYNLVFVDPARRDNVGRKVVSLSDCTPDVTSLPMKLKGRADILLLKLSPMLDWRLAIQTLGCVEEVHIFAEKSEVKDLLLVIRPGIEYTLYDTHLYATDGTTTHLLLRDEQTAQIDYATSPLAYLYEPHPALLKIGAFKWIAKEYDLLKFHPNSHLYTSNTLINNFPGRCFRILRTSSFSRREIKLFIGDTHHAHLAVRNFPQSPSQLLHRLHIEEGGSEYWFATTVHPHTHLLLATEKIY